ncbi:MAG: hypothetical protein KDC79_03885 [Cyclobacteriaceae bacterium]|nr:hypothetical protein [Cyclobacteriaceae bacterium]
MALVFPVLIYLFLRGFGENHFAIPVYYENGISIDGCKDEAGKKHLVQFETYALGEAHLFYFPQWVTNDEFYRQCERIHTKWPQLQFTAIADSSYSKPRIGNKLVVADQKHLYEIANCSLVLGQDSSIHHPAYNQLVLVDTHKQIRGYYKGNELKDMDRLDVELEILNKEEHSL